jgi:hypothetical protein
MMFVGSISATKSSKGWLCVEEQSLARIRSLCRVISQLLFILYIEKMIKRIEKMILLLDCKVYLVMMTQTPMGEKRAANFEWKRGKEWRQYLTGSTNARNPRILCIHN